MKWYEVATAVLNGVVLAACGIFFNAWQFWVILVLLAINNHVGWYSAKKRLGKK